jgi:hypothetical protein
LQVQAISIRHALVGLRLVLTLASTAPNAFATVLMSWHHIDRRPATMLRSQALQEYVEAEESHKCHASRRCFGPRPRLPGRVSHVYAALEVECKDGCADCQACHLSWKLQRLHLQQSCQLHHRLQDSAPLTGTYVLLESKTSWLETPGHETSLIPDLTQQPFPVSCTATW